MNLNLIKETSEDNRSGTRTLENMTQNSNFTVPAELQEVLLDFTVHYLVSQPPDLLDFAMEYFSSLQQRRDAGRSHSEDEDMDSEEEDFMEEPAYQSGGRRKSVFAEAYNPEEDEGVEDVKTVHPKTDEQRQRLLDAVRDCLLFKSLDADQLGEVLDAMFEKRSEPGETIITQGADGDNFYVVESGAFGVIVDTGSGPKKVMTYDNKGSFGELALLYNMPRAATVQAESTGLLWAMDRQTFRKIVLRNAHQKRKMYQNFLQQVDLLSHLDDYERMNIADALISQTYANGDLIIKQGDPANGMYFIEMGKVSVLKRGNNGDEKEVDKQVNEISEGGYFGELGLMNHKPRATSIVAVGDVRVAFLDVSAFERLLGPCMEMMKSRVKDYEEMLVKAFGSTVNLE